MAFDSINDAFHYVSDAPPGERRAVVHRISGQIFLASFKAGYDERPPAAEDDADYLTIPHRHDLDPGKPLVLDFIRTHRPTELPRVEALFARPGAFRNFKDLLRRHHLLESWQIFEEQQLAALLRQWCLANDLPL